MSQQLSRRYPADVVEHGKFGAHLAMLMPPLAALLYPFLLEAFHANIAPAISGQSAEPALRSAAAALFLLLAFAAPIVALLGAMTLGELAAPSVTQRRARTIGFLAVAAPPLFVFLGVELYMLHDPVPDTWVWVAFWLGMTALAGFWRDETPAPPPADAAPAPLRVAHGNRGPGVGGTIT
jgi:hypothetical protein